MKHFIKKFIKHEWETIYGGMGFIQGTGFSLSNRVLKIGKLRIITKIRFDIGGEYTRRLKERIALDDAQQAREKK